MAMLRNGLIVLIVLLMSFGCGGKKMPANQSAEALYQTAMAELSKKEGFPYVFRGTNYDEVFRLLKEIQLRDTYSPYATLAELRTADTYFKREEFEQAAVEYEEFLKNHPAHQETPYATYRLAMSHYMQKRSPDRDPTNTREALKWFGIFIDKYPNSPLVSDAEKRVVRCRKILAEREMYIGRFYEERKNYKAAAERFRVVVNDYNDTNRLETALFLMGESYLKAGETELAKEALQRLVHEFPNAKYHNKASALLSEIEKRGKKEARIYEK
jgi:outer membrane protein assembly factor BamD